MLREMGTFGAVMTVILLVTNCNKIYFALFEPQRGK